jgi:HAMP domain-containing protein
MAITTIIGLALLAFAAVLLFGVLGAALRQRRTTRRRVQAGDIRDRTAEQSHTVSERETLAEETTAQARLTHPEGDAKTAHAAGPKRRSEVATACDDVKEEFERTAG